MPCPVCNAESSAGALFCQQCGHKLAAGTADTERPTGASSPGGSSAGPVGKVADPASLGRRRAVVDVPEETLWEGRYSPKASLGTMVAAAIATVALVVAGVYFEYWIVWLGLVLVLWLLVAVRFAARRLGIHYKMTNQMFYHQRGILTRSTDRIEAIDIDDVTWQQGLFDRLVGVGNIKLSSRDRTDPVFWVVGIEDVENVARLIDKARRAERLRRGFLSIEQTSVDLGT